MIRTVISTAKAMKLIRDNGYVTLLAEGNILHISSEDGSLLGSYYDSKQDKTQTVCYSATCATRIRVSATVLFSFIAEMHREGATIRVI